MLKAFILFFSFVYGKKRHSIPFAHWSNYLLSSNFILGAFLWTVINLLALTNLFYMDYIKQIFLLAPLIMVPMALTAFEFRNVKKWVKELWKQLLWWQGPAAWMVALSFFFSQGTLIAFLLVLPWLLWTGLLALLGLYRLRHLGFRMPAEWAINVSLVYIFFGALWLTASRLALQPMGFGDVIVLLTAMHFHFAGFSTAIILGIIGRILLQQKTKTLFHKLYPYLVFAVLMGMPLVAIGITIQGLIEWINVCIFASSLLVMAFFILKVCVPSALDLSIRMLWRISAYSVFVGMVLALVYAWGIWTKKPLLLIPDMVLTHGFINSMGFVGSALLAFYFQKMKNHISALKKEIAS